MKGFFSNKETESKTRPDGKVVSCASCGLYRDCKSPRMEAYGNFKKRIMTIGEAPGKVEDTKGKPWQGKTGQLLQRTLKGLGIDLFEDCISLNAVNCRPEDNRTPTNYEIDCCRVRVLKLIDEYKPEVILLLGGSAVYSVIGHRWKRDLGGITKWRGWCIPDQDLKAWICPTFHPSYVERGEREVMTIWKQDLREALDCEEFPESKPTKVDQISDLSPLDDITSGVVAIDYETTGLKPHAKGHRIIAAAVADTDDHAWSFLMPKTKREREPLLRLLANPNVKKIAHNIKFEDAWSNARLKQSIGGWGWDSMLAAHLLDNRPGVTSLKFQAYVLLGISDYEQEVSSYLHSKTKGGNELNNIHKLLESRNGITDLLLYVGLDTIYTRRVTAIQLNKMELDFKIMFNKNKEVL